MGELPRRAGRFWPVAARVRVRLDEGFDSGHGATAASVFVCWESCGSAPPLPTPVPRGDALSRDRECMRLVPRCCPRLLPPAGVRLTTEDGGDHGRCPGRTCLMSSVDTAGGPRHHAVPQSAPVEAYLYPRSHGSLVPTCVSACIKTYLRVCTFPSRPSVEIWREPPG